MQICQPQLFQKQKFLPSSSKSRQPDLILENQARFGRRRNPQPQPDTRAKNAPDLRGPFSLELVVNSEGRVCDARVLNAKDQLSANSGRRIHLGTQDIQACHKTRQTRGLEIHH
jgi:hypothetical protein